MHTKNWALTLEHMCTRKRSIRSSAPLISAQSITVAGLSLAPHSIAPDSWLLSKLRWLFDFFCYHVVIYWGLCTYYFLQRDTQALIKTINRQLKNNQNLKAAYQPVPRTRERRLSAPKWKWKRKWKLSQFQEIFSESLSPKVDLQSRFRFHKVVEPTFNSERSSTKRSESGFVRNFRETGGGPSLGLTFINFHL